MHIPLLQQHSQLRENLLTAISFVSDSYCILIPTCSNFVIFFTPLHIYSLVFSLCLRRLTLIQSRVYSLYSLQLLRVSLGVSPLLSANRLQDIRLYGLYVVTRYYVSTYSPPQNTVHTCTVYCTEYNRTYRWGLYHQTSHTDVIQPHLNSMSP